MKAVLFSLSLLFLATPIYAEYVPTPAMAIGFDISKDSRQWERKNMEGSESGFIVEFVPKGDSITFWNEFVAQQIFFTKQSLTDYVKRWKDGFVKADPKVRFEEQQNSDGSVTIDYHSDVANEAGIRRFMKASEGASVSPIF
jgi:hypothetical protein